ncbi:phosphocarrier protein HPr [Endozoicomonas sp. (ex Bugula neritina AB1)]|nr:phosphocarrier protein HPr [Endozoicomonas sp. (ex Bugula neritina AB1)]
MINQDIVVINKLGLHARAASKFVSTSTAYTCQIQVGYNGRTVDGKSIMAIMMLAAGQGSELQLSFDGDDETEACSAICELINNYFEEGE